ncbi:tyrosine-type recombinase/integrase [Streptomyces misionensis]|uniref:tyrosine-type recombinase/integrase n=1 Tax=Streptomyces misionensis TaxID=67331 RepID=UPI0037DA78B7
MADATGNRSHESDPYPQKAGDRTRPAHRPAQRRTLRPALRRPRPRRRHRHHPPHPPAHPYRRSGHPADQDHQLRTAIALPASCVTSLRAHRERQARARDRTGSVRQGSGHVFTRPDGHPIEPATLTRHFNALLRDARLRPIRFHDLRHSTATLLLEQGVRRPSILRACRAVSGSVRRRPRPGPA